MQLVEAKLAVNDVRELRHSFRRHLVALNRADRTLQTYLQSVDQFAAFLVERGMPTRADSVAREHVEAYISDVLSRNKSSTAKVRFSSLQAFFGFLAEVGEVKDSPLSRMSPPKVILPEPPVLSDETLSRLLKVCEGREFVERRDRAVIRTLIDTGVRRAELAALEVADVHLDEAFLWVRRGKGGRSRQTAFGDRTVREIDAYLLARARHPYADLPALWLGAEGALSDSALTKLVARRCRMAGLPAIGLHQFRHAYAHNWLLEGGTERGLMRQLGWSSREMLARYAASAEQARALVEARRLRPGDRFV